MNVIDRLYKKDESIIKSVHIDQDLYSEMQYLSDNIFDASVSKIINVCVENTLIKDKPIKYYKKPNGIDSTYRSVVLRKSFYTKLLEMRDETGISFSRLLNGCIHEFLEDYKDQF